MSDDQPKPPTLDERLASIATALERVIGNQTPPPAAAAQPAAAAALPTVTPAQATIDYAKLAAEIAKAQAPAPAPAAAPLAPTTSHVLPTAAGVVDLFNCSQQQLEQMGPVGVREHLGKLWDLAHQMSGAPARPTPPAARVAVEVDVHRRGGR